MNFELVGKLRLGKETDKFKPYQERVFDSGWVNKTLMFNAICGDNRHMLTIQGGTYQDRSDYKIKTCGPSGKDDNGNFVAGEKLDIPWKDRLLDNNIQKVAENRKFIVDLEEHGRRVLLQRLSDRLHEGGSVSDEDLKSVGLTDEGQINEALEKSKKKRHEFISAWDQAEFMKKVFDSGKYNDQKFFIRGTITKQYSDQNQRWYENLTPQRIYLADDDAEEYSTGNAVVYFNHDAVDDGSLDEKGKYYINAYTLEYDFARAKNIPCPIQLVVNKAANEGEEKKVKRIVDKFRIDDDKWKQYGVEFSMLNGSQKVEITPDMLTDDQKEDLECGLITMDDIRREYGGSVYGDRVQEYRVVKPIRGYTKGPQDTVYTDDDMKMPPLTDTQDDNGKDGLFDDDDDEL